MIKKTFLGLLLLALLSIYGCQITPANHKPLLLDMNSNNGSNSISLDFNISDNDNAVTLFRGYAFIAKLPSGSYDSTGSVGCSVKNSAISTTTPPTFTGSYAAANNEIRCVYDETATSGITLSGDVTVTFTRLNLKVNSYDRVSLGLYTSVDDGVIIINNPAFRSFAIYNKYSDMNSQNAYLVLSNPLVSNQTTSLSCVSPCTTLYPYSDFSVSFKVTVNKYINTNDVKIGFEINSKSDLSNLAISSAAITETTTTADPLKSQLKSSTGALTITKNDEKYYITDIATYVDSSATQKVYMLDAKREFTITLSGFSTGNIANNSSAIEDIAIFASWKNTKSYFSYNKYVLSGSTKVNYLNFESSVVSSSNTLSSSVSHSDGTSIYENGAWPLTFNIRIPKVKAGTLKITSKATGNVVLSLIASTCDFSEDSAFSNTFGSRPVCAPTGYTDATGRSFTATGNDSSIEIKFDDVSGSFRDLKLNVWAYANKCTDYSYDTTSSKKVYLDSILGNGTPSFNPMFEYSFTTDGENGVVVAYSTFTSNLDCKKNYRATSGNIEKFNINTITDIEDMIDEGATPAKDYLLYTEVTNWNPRTGYNYTPAGTNIEESLTVSTLDTDYKFLNEINTADTNFAIFVKSDDIKKNLVLPNTIDSTADPHTLKYLEGRIVIEFPEYLVKPTSNSVCVLSFVSEDDDDTKTFRLNGTTANFDDINNISTYKIQTTTVNGTTNGMKQVLKYNKYGSETANYESETFGLFSNCYTFKIYSELTIKSIFQHVSMFVNFERKIETTVFKQNRVNRFFKFFNGLSYGFRNPTNSGSLIGSNVSNTDSINLTRPFASNTDVNKLCILEIDQSFFTSSTTNGINTIVVTLMNNRLSKIGEYNPNDYYPISKVNSIIKTYPLYTIEPTDLEASNAMDSAILINTGLLYDLENLDSIVPFLSNSIVFTGVSGDISADTTSPDNVYMPIPCGFKENTKSKIIVHGYLISGSTVSNSNSLIYHNSSIAIYSSSVIGSATLADNTVLLNFPGYRTTLNDTDSSNANKVTLTGLQYFTKFKASILLVNDVIALSTSGDSGFLGTSFIDGHYSSVTINGNSYSNYFFAKTNDFAVTDSSTLNFLNRPVYKSSGSTSKIKIHAIGADATTGSGYITNDEDVLIKSDSGVALTDDDEATSNLSFEITNTETIYFGDYGANITISARIYSDFATTGKLTIYSSSFNSSTTCVNNDNTAECEFTSSSTNYMTCKNVSVGANLYTSVIYDCYNIKINGTLASSTITISNLSNFKSDDTLLDLTAKGDNSYEKSFLSAPAVTDIIPSVQSINFVQSRNLGGLSNAYIRINLGRSYRLGQTVILTGAVDTLFIGDTKPLCSFMLVPTSSNFDEIDFYDNVTSGAYFINSCKFGTTIGVNFTITLTTRNYLPTKSTFSQYVLIRLSPVYVANLSTAKYNITTYLEDNATSKIAADPELNKVNFPSGNVSLSAYTVSPAATTGLCNLSDIFPRIPSTIGHLTFKVVLNGTTDLLTTINTVDEVPNVTSKVLNEVSIFMNPLIYMRNENIWCSYNSANIPCTWTTQGYINVKFSTNLADGEYDITIKGVTIPNIAKDSNDSNFNCSVNYFNEDSSENLIVGTGTSTIYTYAPTTKIGNIIQYTSPNGMVSTTEPRSNGTFNFRMNIDTSLGLTDLPQVFTATTDGNSPVLLIGFPSEYNFSNIGAVTATLTSTKFSPVTVVDEANSTESTYTSFGDPATVPTSSIEVKGNFIIITLTEAITVDSDVAYFDLVLNNIPTPWSAVNGGSLINIYMMNELTAPTMMFSTYTNLNDSSGDLIDFNNYYQGPSFKFNIDNKALINTGSSTYSLKPGRYMPINFTVIPGKNANASTTLSLATNATIKSLQSSITLNTGLTKTGTLSLGVSCNTLPGSYWASFSLAATTGFYGLSPIRVVVTPVTGNKASLYVNSMINTYATISAYTLVNGGFTRAYINTQYPVVDAVNISFSIPTAATNDAGFTKFSADATEDIAAGKMSSHFSYTISSSSDTISAQQITLTSENKCFGFGSATADTRTLTYTVEGSLANLYDVNIASMFLYDVSNESKNEIDLLFTPIANTNAVFALVCADSEYPTYATATSSSIANLDSTLYKIQSGTYTDITQTTISFSGLKRGTSYKLKVWLSNFGATNNNLTSYEANSIVSSTNSTDIVELKTAALPTKVFLKFVFGSAQSDIFTERLLLNTQKFVNTLAPNAKIFVARATKGAASVYAQGYGSETIETCSATYFTDNYGETQSESTSSATDTATDAATTTLRYLQTSQTYYYVINQSATDSVAVDLTSIKTQVSAKLTTVTSLKEFVGTDVSFTGETFATEDVVEVQMTAENFIVDSASYDKTTGNITLIPKADREITCNWKLNNAADLLTADVILDCAAGTSNCGTINFKVDNTETTTLAVGTLADGSYYVNVYCTSDIPDSTNNIIFKNADALTVTTEVPSSTDTSSTAVDCSVTPDDPSCYSMFIKLSITIFALLALAFFDF